VAPDGSRKTIRLGKCDRKSAESICRHVEALLAAQVAGQPVPLDTAAWLSRIRDPLRSRLAAVGLIDAPAPVLTVSQYLTDWLTNKAAAGHPQSTIRAWEVVISEIVAVFGDRPLSALTHADGEAFRSKLLARGLRPATVHTRLGYARQMFEDAVRHGHLPSNPWRYVRHRKGNPAERRAYVSVADVERVIEYCPSVYLRLLVALARYGGLRIPSEALALTWANVNWEHGKLTVPSPKTVRCGKPYRVIPLFPLLRPHLGAVWDITPEGETYVFPARQVRPGSLRGSLLAGC
jgi:integrase